MDSIDKKIINRIQSNFPITSRPYLYIANEFGLDESEIIKRITNLKNTGIIRRIGGNFVPEKVGFVSTLCAAKVPEDKIDSFARIVNKYKGVTHNYQRENAYNVWFTFIASSMKKIELRLKEIAEKTGINKIINLPSTNVFKIKAQFKVS